jgi:signal peptidase I
MDSRVKRSVGVELATEAIGRGMDTLFRTIGPSMEPLLERGDRGVVRSRNPEDLQPGDLVVYRLADVPVCHRVLRSWDEEGKRRLLTKGDGLFTRDAPVHASQIIGQVIEVRKRGRVLRLDSPGGRLLARMLLLHSLVTLLAGRLFPCLSKPPEAGRRNAAAAGCRMLRSALRLPAAILVRLWPTTRQRAMI